MQENVLGAGVFFYAKGDAAVKAQELLQQILGLNRGMDDLGRTTRRTTADINDFTRSFQFLVMGRLGSDIASIGRGIEEMGARGINTITRLGKTIISTASEFERYEVQLSTLFKENEPGNPMTRTREEFEKIIDLAKRTPFVTSSLVSTASIFRAQGIDPFQLIEGRDGEMREFILFAGDLAGALGRSLEDAQFSIREAVSGDWRSMRTRFNIGLGLIEEVVTRVRLRRLEEEMAKLRELGATEEELLRKRTELMQQLEIVNGQFKMSTDSGTEGAQSRLRALADFIGELYGGGMEALARSTEGVMERITDSWQIFLYEVGSRSGFLQAYKDTLEGVYDLTEDLQKTGYSTKLAEALGGAFRDLWRPVDAVSKALGQVLNRIAEFSAQSPTAMRLLLMLPALISAILMGTGKIVQSFGSMIQLISFLLLINNQFMIMNQITGKRITLMGAFTGTVARLTARLVLLSVVLGALYLAWRMNFLGMRDRVEQWGKSVKEALDLVKDLYESEGIDEFRKKWDQINESGNRTAVTLGRVITAAEGIAQALFVTPNMLTEDTYLKLIETDTLSLVETLLDLKQNMTSFIKGMEEGIKEAWVVVGPAFRVIGWVADRVIGLFELIAGVAKDAGEASEDAFYETGESIGKRLMYLLTLGILVKTIVPVFNTLKTIVTWLTSAGVITKLGTFLTTLFSGPWGWIIAALAAIGTLIYLNWDIIVEWWDRIKTAVENFFGAIKRGWEWIQVNILGKRPQGGALMEYTPMTPESSIGSPWINPDYQSMKEQWEAYQDMYNAFQNTGMSDEEYRRIFNAITGLDQYEDETSNQRDAYQGMYQNTEISDEEYQHIFNTTTLDQFNATILDQFNAITLDQFNATTLDLFNATTLDQFNVTTLDQFDAITILDQYKDETPNQRDAYQGMYQNTRQNTGMPDEEYQYIFNTITLDQFNTITGLNQYEDETSTLPEPGPPVPSIAELSAGRGNIMSPLEIGQFNLNLNLPNVKDPYDFNDPRVLDEITDSVIVQLQRRMLEDSRRNHTN